MTKILKVLLKVLSEKIKSIDILNAEENIEEWGEFNRKVGFEKLIVNFNSM